MANEVVISKSTALNIADMLEAYQYSRQYDGEDIKRYIKELRGEL